MIINRKITITNSMDWPLKIIKVYLELNVNNAIMKPTQKTKLSTT